MKKGIFLTITLLISLGITGCSQKTSSANSSASSSSVKKVSLTKDKKVTQAASKKDEDDKTKDNPKSKKSSIWNKNKSKQLNDLVDKWSAAASQSYREYTGHDVIKTAGGVTYPAAFSHKKFSIDNHEEITIGWSPEGKNLYDYNVVALYNRNVEENGWHTTYLFCLHQGKPEVLIDSTSNVDVIPLTLNTDENLNQGFAKIVNENK